MHAAAAGPACTDRRSAGPRSTPTARAATRSSSPPPCVRPVEVARELAQPVPGGAQHDVLRAGAAQVARQLVALLGGTRREALSDLAAVRVDAQLAPRLRVYQPQVADRRQLLLAGV